jgi:MFS family permease
MGVAIYLPMWIQVLLGRSATSSGLTLMPMSVAWQLGAVLAGNLMYRLGSKTTIVIGSVTVAVGTLWLTALQIESPYWFIAGILILIGFGMGYIATPATVLVQSSVSWEWRGAATASNTLMLSLGQTVGIAAFGSLLNSTLADTVNSQLSTDMQLTHGLHLVFMFSFGIALLNMIVVFFLPTNRKILEQQLE